VAEEEWNVNGRPTGEEWKEVYIGWPEGGGVLVLDDFKDEIPWNIGMLRLATTMEERCRLLRDKFEATYYEDPIMYPRFAVLSPNPPKNKA
jgi:hypothetical protein